MIIYIFIQVLFDLYVCSFCLEIHFIIEQVKSISCFASEICKNELYIHLQFKKELLKFPI